MGRKVSSGQKVGQAERRHQVAQLRRAGLTVAQIADELDVGTATVNRDLRHLLTTLRAEALQDIDSWVSAQLSELQKVRDIVWDTLTSTTAEDVPRGPLLGQVLRAQEREAKLLGLEQTIVAPAAVMIDEDRARQILVEMGYTE